MKVLIRNELKKLFSKDKTYISIIALIFLVVVIACNTYREASSRPMTDYKESIKSSEAKLKEEEKKLTLQGKNEAEIEKTKQTIEYHKHFIQDCEEELIWRQGSNWKAKLKENNKILLENKDKKSKENNNSGINSEEDIDPYDTLVYAGKDAESLLKIRKNNYLIDNNIKPMETSDYNAYTFIYDIINTLGMLFIAIFIAIFSADVVSGEFVPPTMKILLTQPIKRGKVLFSKYISNLISLIVIIIGIELLAFVILGMKFGFGNSMYPNFVGMKYFYSGVTSTGDKAIKLAAGTGFIIPSWKFLLYSILIQILFIIAVFSFTFALSVIFKNSMAALALNVVSVVFFQVFESFPGMSKYTKFIFLTFGQTVSVLNGNIIIELQNIGITVLFAAIILLVYTVFFYMLSHIIFKKRDVLI